MRLPLALLLVSLLTGCCCPPRPTCCHPPASVPAADQAEVAEPKRDDPSGADGRAVTASAAMLQNLESKRVKGLDWKEQNLDQVLSYLRTITGLNFYLTPKARDEKFDDVLITIQLDDVSVKTILDSVVTEPFELTWEPRAGVIWILTPDEVGGSMRLRYFDVKDLVGEAPRQWTSGSKLAHELKLTVHTSYWGRENAALESRNHILIVRASESVLQAVADFLAQERHRLATNPVLAPATK